MTDERLAKFRDEAAKRRRRVANIMLQEIDGNTMEEELIAEVERLRAFSPMSAKEAEAAYDAAEPVPVSEQMIKGMVKYATDDDYRAVADQNADMRREIERLRADAARLATLEQWAWSEFHLFETVGEMVQSGTPLGKAIDAVELTQEVNEAISGQQEAI